MFDSHTMYYVAKYFDHSLLNEFSPEYNSLRHTGLDADPMTDISTSYLTLIHQSRGLLCPSGRPHLLYKANGRKRNYDTSDICHTGYCLTGLTSVCISFQCSDGRELRAVCKGETKYLMWANEGIMGIFSFLWVSSIFWHSLFGVSLQSRSTFDTNTSASTHSYCSIQ